MRTLTDDGRKQVAAIAERHGVSTAAASDLLSAIAAGGGRQAQFNHPELGGMGQWSQGGMIMVGDMFNRDLKARVAALCDDLADLLKGSTPFTSDDKQPSAKQQGAGRWPDELGRASSSGSQNDMHYAVFPETNRLAIEQEGRVTVYDTGDHRIGGVSQQQSGDQSLRFTSQTGEVRVAELPVVSDTDQGPSAADASHDRAPAEAKKPDAGSDDEVFSRLERLADLRSRDVITAEEFAAKKAELLARF